MLMRVANFLLWFTHTFQGFIRFEDDTKAADVIEKATTAATDGKLMVRESELTVRVLEGEEETEHWKQVYETKSKMRLRKRMSGMY